MNPKKFRYDGRDLRTPLGFQEGEKGIFGIFNVDIHPADKANIAIFYPGVGDEAEFHHPTDLDYEYPNHGFQDFLAERLKSKINVCGGKEGIYSFRNGKLCVTRTTSNTASDYKDLLNRLFPKNRLNFEE